jgi:leucyl aminopeptidase
MAITFHAKSSKLQRALARQDERANLILPIFSGEALTGHSLAANELTKGLVSRRMELEEFDPKIKQFMVIDTDLSVDGLDKIILVGMGARSKLTVDLLRTALCVALIAARDTAHSEHLVFPLIDWDIRGLTVEQFAEVVTEYACLIDYEINHQKTIEEDDAPTHLESVTLLSSEGTLSAAKKGMKYGRLVGEATCRARDMVNEPSDTMTPQKLAKIAKDIAAESGGLVKCTVYTKAGIEKLGMGGLLAVNRASTENGPVLIDMSYEGPGAGDEVIGLVGKGITFDSGGLAIKDADGMKDMKDDMGGAAAVLQAMSLLAVLKPAVKVRAVVAGTENLLDSLSYRPGSVIKTMSGKTVEIGDTDAEGRMTLCDAIHYVQTKGATKVIDLATLTGSVEEALGDAVTGVFGNDPAFTKEFLKSARLAGEDMWELPLPERYRDNNKSPMADLTNDGSGPGAIAAAWFLREFVQEGVSWIHCDIAGSSFRRSGDGTDPDGASGVGVRTLVRLLTED